MSSSRRSSNGRSPLVNQQRQITSFFNKNPTREDSFVKPNPRSHPNSSPIPNPSTIANTHSSNQFKRKKPPLVIGDASSSPGHSPVAGVKEESYGESVVGKKIKVYCPLDKIWYDGRVKMFDENAGKHLVQYDDADEEFILLGNEKVEWVEETMKKLKRLRRGSSSPASAAVVEDIEEKI